MARYRISGVPIVDGGGKLVGILTNRDLRFVEDHEQVIERVMKAAPLVTAPVGTTLEQAKDILWQHRIEKLPIVDDAGALRGLITVKDIKKQTEYPLATQDERRAASASAPPSASVPTPSSGPRPSSPAGVDLLVVDTSHGHSQGVLDVVQDDQGRLRRSRSSAATSPPPRPPRRWSPPAPTRVKVGRRARARSAPPAWSRGSACRRSRPSTTAPPRPSGTASR